MFNIFLQEYLCKRLHSLNSEEYSLLSPTERNEIISKNRIVNFVKRKNIFTTLNILTKIGINWGFYIIDENIDIKEHQELVKNKEFITSDNDIEIALKTKKSFITNSRFFASLQNLYVNNSHGQEAIHERRYIQASEFITKKIPENFDTYSLLHPEVEFKKASEGSQIMLDIIRKLPVIKTYCKKLGLTQSDFIMLCEMYYHAENSYTKQDIEKLFGKPYVKRLLVLEKRGYVFRNETKNYISQKGILLVGNVMSHFLGHVYLP